MMKLVVNIFDIGWDKTRVSVIFSGTREWLRPPHVAFQFSDNKTAAYIADYLSETQYQDYDFLHLTFKLAAELLQGEGSRSNVTKVVLGKNNWQ